MVIKTAILQSQYDAAKTVNEKQRVLQGFGGRATNKQAARLANLAACAK